MKLYNPCIEMCKMLWYGPDEEGDFYSMGTYRYIRSVRNRNRVCRRAQDIHLKKHFNNETIKTSRRSDFKYDVDRPDSFVLDYLSSKEGKQGENPSQNMYASARGLAKLGAFMAH